MITQVIGSPEEARLCGVWGQSPGLTLSPVWPVS